MSTSTTIPADLTNNKIHKNRHIDYPRIGLWIALVISCIIWAFPFFIAAFTSVKSPQALSSTPAWLPPDDIQWSNYPDAIEDGGLWRTVTNSLIISVIKVPIGLIFAAFAAFALARLKPKGFKLMLGIFAAGSMVPIQVALGPLFNVILNLGLINTRLGLILPYLAFGIPYQIFMMYGFFRAIPDELEESARLDGVSTFRLFWQICIPLAKPALAALFILDFVATWNEYAIARTLIQTQEMWTVPLAVQGFSSTYSTDYAGMNAFILMSAVPVLVVYLLFQRYFVSGGLAGAVKG